MEYQFPVVAMSRDKHAPNAMATEVMRVASKKVVDNGKYLIYMGINIINVKNQIMM